MTVSAWPLRNSARARISTAIAVLRSPISISTTPRPRTWMPPPSSVAGWWARSSSPDRIGNAASANIG